MRVALSTCGDARRLARLAVKLRTLGAEVRMCVPPDRAKLPGNAGVPLVAIGAWR